MERVPGVFRTGRQVEQGELDGPWWDQLGSKPPGAARERAGRPRVELAGRFPDRVGSGCGIGSGLSAAIVTGANAKLLRPGVVAYAGREVVVDVAGVDARGPQHVAL